MTFSVVTFAQKENSDLDNFAVLNKDSLEYVPWVVKDFKTVILTSNEIDLVDSLFQDFKTKSNNGDTTIQAMREIGLMNYKRQYLPVLNDNGEKIVWINCFCVSVLFAATSNLAPIVVDEKSPIPTFPIGVLYISLFIKVQSPSSPVVIVDGSVQVITPSASETGI